MHSTHAIVKSGPDRTPAILPVEFALSIVNQCFVELKEKFILASQRWHAAESL